MALDRVNRRLFIPAYGNGGFRAFQLDEHGMPTERSAMYVIGRESLYGRRSAPAADERELAFPGSIAFFDNSTQRLFGVDRFNNRILVFDVAPDDVERYPAARVVIGQPDFQSTIRGVGPNRFGMTAGAAIDEAGQRMWVPDPPNNRVLMFDIHPDRLRSDPDALLVLGQPDFESRAPGLGPGAMAGPMSVTYDPVFDRLFVADMGNERVLVFDVAAERLRSGASAVAVMGQPGFHSREPRRALDQLKPESLSYDFVNHRLFIAEDLNHRIMVYDAHPDRVGGPATAIAVVGQPDAFTTSPRISQSRLAMPRLAVDPTAQKLYVSEGFPAGNRISIWDVRPDNLSTGMLASDLLGHETVEGEPDFDSRIPQGRLDGRSLAAARAVTLDPVDHRLFVADEYNHRVVVWQLDGLNRVSDRSARWVLGQPDVRSSYMGQPSASNMTVPLAVAYDAASKRVFVGDGYHNRVLVYDASPGTLTSGMPASAVIGQRDFESVEFGAGRTGLNFGVRMGRGIASNFLPMGLAVDEAGQRLFVSDGENNRVLVYDIADGALPTAGAAATTVLGQPDFGRTDPGGGRHGLHDPGHLAYDPTAGRLFVIDAKNRRVVVFDARPDALKDGAAAIGVIGQPDLDAGPARQGGRGMMSGTSRLSRADVTDAMLVAPNGIAYDRQRDLLYVSDAVVPADRILVFDVDPTTFRDGAAAMTVLGASDADAGPPGVFGGSKGYPGQFTVRDTRGIALDDANGRLFVTGSFESRVVVFHFPRARWTYDVAGHAVQRFNTLDAVDLGVKAQPYSAGTASLPSTEAPAAMAMYSVTEMFADRRTQRHTRMLLSEAAVPASPAVRRATLLVDGADERRHDLYLRNPGVASVLVQFALHDRDGVRTAAWTRSVPAGGQIAVSVEESAPDGVSPSAALVLESDEPVAVTALRRTTNARDETLLAPIPMAVGGASRARQILPLVQSGGGRQTDVVLINDSDAPARGTVSLRDAVGNRAPLGLDSVLLSYAVPPHAARVFTTDLIGPTTRSGYAFVTPLEGDAPLVAGLVRHRAGDVWTSEHLVSSGESRSARFAVSTVPTLVRHGAIATEVVVTNAGARPTAVTFALEGAAEVTRSLAAGQQLRLGLDELFGERARGLVRIDGDAPLAVTARQVTTNFRAEAVAVELPRLRLEAGRTFSFVPDGGGYSTEFRLANLGAAPLEGALEFRTTEGDLDRGMILK